jgi:hypothetical protein
LIQNAGGVWRVKQEDHWFKVSLSYHKEIMSQKTKERQKKRKKKEKKRKEKQMNSTTTNKTEYVERLKGVLLGIDTGMVRRLDFMQLVGVGVVLCIQHDF